MRNVYLLVNYGDYVDGAKTKASPYVQLLSTTNPASAHLDFINVRLGGIDTTGSQVFATNLTNTPNDLDVHKSSDHAKTATIIGAVTGTAFLVVTCVIVFFMYQRRQRRRLAPAADFSTANMGTFSDTSYRPLLLPAPPGEFNPVLGYHDEAVLTSTHDFRPEDLYAQFAPSHGEENHVTPLSRYEEADPRNTR